MTMQEAINNFRQLKKDLTRVDISQVHSITQEAFKQFARDLRTVPIEELRPEVTIAKRLQKLIFQEKERRVRGANANY
jgi:hypothetical protein